MLSRWWIIFAIPNAVGLSPSKPSPLFPSPSHPLHPRPCHSCFSPSLSPCLSPSPSPFRYYPPLCCHKDFPSHTTSHDPDHQTLCNTYRSNCTLQLCGGWCKERWQEILFGMDWTCIKMWQASGFLTRIELSWPQEIPIQFESLPPGSQLSVLAGNWLNWSQQTR